MILKRNKQSPRPTGRGQSDRPAANRMVYSYYSGRPDSDAAMQRSDPIVRQRLPGSWWARHVPSILASIAIFICILYVLGVDTNVKITLGTNGTATTVYRDEAVYQEAVNAIVARSFWSRSKLTIDRNAIIEDIKQLFPELAGVDITLPIMGRRPVVDMTLAEPALMISSRSNVYLLNERGVVLISALEARQLRKQALVTVQDDSGLAMEVGKPALPASDVAFIRQVAAQFAHKNMPVTSMTLPAIARELHVRTDGLPYYIKFNTLTDARQQSGTYFAVKERLEAAGTTPAEYVDVRVDGKAYYK